MRQNTPHYHHPERSLILNCAYHASKELFLLLHLHPPTFKHRSSATIWLLYFAAALLNPLSSEGRGFCLCLNRLTGQLAIPKQIVCGANLSMMICGYVVIKFAVHQVWRGSEPDVTIKEWIVIDGSTMVTLPFRQDSNCIRILHQRILWAPPLD